MSEKLPSLQIGRHTAEFPIVLGGMSTGLTGPELVAAVANEGGFGTLAGVGWGLEDGINNNADYLERNKIVLGEKIRKAQELSKNDNVFVNLMVAVKDYKESVGVAVQNRVGGIVSGAGPQIYLPKYVLEYAKEYDIGPGEEPELIPVFSLAKSARQVTNRWQRDYGEEWKKRFGKTLLPSAVVVETPRDAGGHLGAIPDHIYKPEYTLETVVPGLVEMMGKYALDCQYEPWYKDIPDKPLGIPVIAAGGIWNRDDIDRMLELGAGGVQMATRFIATEECNASQNFKDRHMDNPNGDPIVVMTSPVGMPGRAYDSELVQRVNAGEKIDLGTCVNCLEVCKHRDTKKMSSYCIIRALYNARMGDVENGILFTGSNGDRLKADREKGIHTARQIINELTKPETNGK